MSVYIDCLNKFFKENKFSKKLTYKQLIKLSKDNSISIFNTLGFIQKQSYIWSWSSPVNKSFDVINEGLSFKYLQYGLTIFKNDKMTEDDYFKVYIRYILTKSNIKLNNNFDLILFLSILNYIKNKNNKLVILKYTKNKEKKKDKKNRTEGWKNVNLVKITHIDYSDIELDNDKYFYKIFELPQKLLN